MQIHVTLAWWAIPLAITVAGFIGVEIYRRTEQGIFAGIGAVMLTVPVLLVSMIAWIIAAFLK